MNKLAELIGVILGDGNIFIKEDKCYQLRIACHANNDLGYVLYLNKLIKKVFNEQPYNYHKRNVIYVSISKRSIIEQLLLNGPKAGNKKKNNQGVPDWIFRKDSFMKNCLRGILDTDGCVYPKTKKHKTPSIWLKSAIPKLRNDVTIMLKLLGYTPQKWAKTSDPDVLQLCIGKSNEVIRFFKEVKFKNPKHIHRFRRSCNLARSRIKQLIGS